MFYLLNLMGYLVDVDAAVVCLLLVVTVSALCKKEKDNQEENKRLEPLVLELV